MKLHQKIFFHPIITPHFDSLHASYFGMENVIAKIPSCKTSSCEYEYEVQNERDRERKKRMNVNLPNGHMEEEFLIFCLSTCSGNKDSCLDVFRYAGKLSFFYDRVLVYFWYG